MDLTYEGKTFHPNIKDKQIKSKAKALGYCAKEDPEPLQYNMDIKEETKARESKKKIISLDLIHGKRKLTEAIETGDIAIQDACRTY